MAQVQLLKTAVGPKPFEKKRFDSLLNSDEEPLPWIPFLKASVPNAALREFGASYLAAAASVGPIRSLKP